LTANYNYARSMRAISQILWFDLSKSLQAENLSKSLHPVHPDFQPRECKISYNKLFPNKPIRLRSMNEGGGGGLHLFTKQNIVICFKLKIYI